MRKLEPLDLLQLTASLSSIFTFLILLIGFSKLIGGDAVSGTISSFQGSIYIIFAAILAVISFGLWKKMKWSRYAGIAMSVLLVLVSIFTFSFLKIFVFFGSGFAFYVLYMNNDVKELFNQ